MRIKFLLTFVVTTLAINAFGQINGQIISKEKVVFLSFEEVKGIDKYCSKDKYESAYKDKNISFEKITYYSDSLKVIAYYIKSKSDANEKLPIIVFNRGSLVRNDIVYVHAPLFKTFVENGFSVIVPALRGSEGGEGRDENGGGDVNDIMNILPVLKELNSIDTSNIFMYGESRGGYMTFLAAKKGFPIKAMATVGAITNMELYLNNNPRIASFALQIWPDFNENKNQLLKSRSVIHWANDINVPTFLLHGNNDSQVRPIHSLNLASKFQDLEKNYQLLVVEGGGHRLSGDYSENRNKKIISWFKKYL